MGKKNKKNCDTCLYYQMVKQKDEDKGIRERDCFNPKSPLFKNGMEKDERCECWEKKTRQGMKMLEARKKYKNKRKGW